MACTLQFVDSIASSPTVRLDLSDGSTWTVLRPGTDFSPPPLRRSIASTLLQDGGVVPAAAYELRTVTLELALGTTSADATATALQNLYRELDRPGGNILKWQEHTTEPVFFRTFRTSATSVRRLGFADGRRKRIEVEIPAEPFGYGLEESLGTFTVHNDPAATGGMELDGTGDFASTPDDAAFRFTGDVELRGWLGPTALPPAARSFVVGRWQAAGDQRSYRLTVETNGQLRFAWSTDGTSAGASTENSTATIDSYDRGVAVAASFDADDGGGNHVVKFYTASDIDAAAGDWTQLGSTVTNASNTSIHAGTAPLTVGADADGNDPYDGEIRAAQVRDAFDLGGAAVASPDFEAEDAGTASFDDAQGNTWTLQGDAAIVDVNPCHVDIPAADIKGDVEAPMRIRRDENGSDILASLFAEVFAMRRRGDPDNVPYLLQAEDMTQGTDTSVQTGDEDFSGAGDNYSRCTFSGTATLDERLAVGKHPATAGVDVRGTYRVFGRFRLTSSSDTIRAQIRYGGPSIVAGFDAAVTLPAVTLPQKSNMRLVDLGLIQIPVGVAARQNGPSGEQLAAEGVRIELWAARDSGSGNLDIDYLLLVPADERLSIVELTDTWNLSDDSGVVIDSYSDLMYVHRSDDDAIVNNGVGAITGSLPMLLPGVTNRLYYLAAVGGDGVQHQIASTYDLAVSYWPRYLSIRGD